MPRGKANDCYKHLIPSIVGNGSHWFPANINHPDSLVSRPDIEISAKDGPVRLDKDFIKSMEKYLDGVVKSLGEHRDRTKGRGKRGRSSKAEGGDKDGKTKSRSAAKGKEEGGDEDGKTKSRSAAKGKDAEAVREREREKDDGQGERRRSSERKSEREGATERDEDGKMEVESAVKKTKRK